MPPTTMGKNGFKVGKPDPPGPDEDPSKPNGKNRKGETIRYFSCTAKYHLISGCPNASSTLRAYFVQPLEVTATFLCNYLGDAKSEDDGESDQQWN